MDDPWITVPKKKESEDWISVPKQTPQKGERTGSYLGKTLSNVPKSAFEYGKAVTAPIHSPVQTFKGIGQLAEEANWPEHILKSILEGKELFPGVRAIAKNYAERYGGWENLKKTFQEDPVGTVADFATLLTSAGGIIPKVGMVGQAMEPLNVARRVVSLPFKGVPQAAPNKLYESAAKFSTTLTRPERLKMVNTALTNEIGVSLKGVDKVKKLVDELNDKISQKVAQVSQTGQYHLNVDDLFRHFGRLYDEALLSGRPIQNIKMLDKIKRDIRTALTTQKPLGLVPDEVQKLKQNIYKDLDNYYSQVKESPISVKGQKAVAKAAKEELESIIPEIKMLNAKEGALIELKDALERASNRITNRDLLGIGTPIKGTMGGVIGGPPGAAAGIVLGIFDTAPVKSKLAIVINRLRQKGITVKPTPTAIRLGLFETRKEEEEIPIQ